LGEIAITSIKHPRSGQKSFSALLTPQFQRGTTNQSVQFDSPSFSCQVEVGFIGDYLADNLSPASRQTFESHLHTCPDCAAFLQTYKKTIEMTRSFLRLQPTRVQPLRSALRRPLL